MHNPTVDNGNGFVDLQGVKFYFPKAPVKTDILFSHLPKKRQKWQRHELPSFSVSDIDWVIDEPETTDYLVTWEEARRQETIKKKGVDVWDLDRYGAPKSVKGVDIDPDYCMECLQNFEEQELDRYFDGVWIMVNGKSIYLTGSYYKYLQWHKNDNGYPDFYITELNEFYHWEATKHSLSDFGVVKITQRGRGKSAKMGSIAYDETVKNPNAMVTGQGRNDDDAEKFFKEKIVAPYKHYPDFLIPVNSIPTNATNNLIFSPSSKSGKNAAVFRKEQREALNSVCDFSKAGEKAVDGRTLRFYWAEEPGKLDAKKVADVYKRHNVNRYCVYRNSKKIGNMMYATTVEDIDKGGAEFKRLWEASDPKNRDENGQTDSGLCKYFISALENTIFDEYGYPVVEDPTDEQRKYISERYGSAYGDGAKPYHERKRKAAKREGLSEWVQYIQKFPFNEDEAFWFNGKECVYNAEILQAAQIKLTGSEKDRYATRGDFVWSEKDIKAMWMPNSVNGRWMLSYLLPEDLQNKVRSKGSFNGSKSFKPLNGHFVKAGFDPISHKAVVDTNKQSLAAGAIRIKQNFFIPEEHCDTWCADYLARPLDPEDAYEDMIIAAFFHGSPVLIENNKNACIQYFMKRGYDEFVMRRPESTLTSGRNQITPGLPSNTPMIEYYVDLTKTDINKNGHKINHIRIVRDFLDFEPNNTTKYDSAVAASLSVVASEKKEKEVNEKFNLGSVFRTYDNSSSISKIN
jgi:hypothetical protein